MMVFITSFWIRGKPMQGAENVLIAYNEFLFCTLFMGFDDLSGRYVVFNVKKKT